VIVFEALEIDFDLIAGDQFTIPLAKRDDAIALEADVDDGVFLADADHAATNDLVLGDLGEGLIDQLLELCIARLALPCLVVRFVDLVETENSPDDLAGVANLGLGKVAADSTEVTSSASSVVTPASEADGMSTFCVTSSTASSRTRPTPPSPVVFVSDLLLCFCYPGRRW
jgi:hypothetical protein